MTQPLSNKRRRLSDLCSYINVHGHEVVNRRVVEERTRLEQTEVFGWRADVIMFRRFRRIPLDDEGARLFTSFYWSVMVDEENGFTDRHQKEIMEKVIGKVLVPFIYKNRVWCLDEASGQFQWISLKH